MRKSILLQRFAMVMMLGGVSSSTLAAPADVTLELQPASQTEVAGHKVEIELYAQADPAEPVGMILAIIEWDPDKLELNGNHEVGAYGWAFSGFQNGGLNGTCSSVHGPCDGWGDGKAVYVAQISGDCQTAEATPGGLLATTLEFTTTADLGTFAVSIIPSHESTTTVVCDNLPGGCGGQCGGPALGPAVTVSVVACSEHTQCADDNECTFDVCDDGVCSYVITYDPETYCCNPASGALTLLDDGNDCTYNECDPETGQVSHPHKPSATPCGDSSDTICTEPDTCDGAGVCQPNHAPNGSWCELEGDECTNDRCADGECVIMSTEEDGTPCDDGQDHCTPGQDECQGGVCTGTGANPCPPLDPALPFCQDRVEEGDDCSTNGDADCDTAAEFYCEVTATGEPCPDGGSDCTCRRPFACVECAEHSNCFDDGDCYAPRCSPLGECFNVVDHTRCFDTTWCNGEEICVLSGDPLVGHCEADPNPPCPDPQYPICLEATCCDGEVCGEDLCACVECDDDGDCDDGDPCNGVETCYTGNQAYVCLPGDPINCKLGICSITGLPCDLPEDCQFGGGVCLKGICSDSGTPCVEAQDCPAGEFCNTGVCSESLTVCEQDTDCPAGEFCADTVCNVGLCDPVSGDCYLEVIAEYVGTPGVCDDNEPCLFLDTCTGEGACVGSPPPLDGSVDLDWEPGTQITVDILDEVRIDLYAFSNDSANYDISAVNAVLNWDPQVLELITWEDPCTIMDDCPICVDASDCTSLGVGCYCAGGTPCGDPEDPTGLCVTGTYNWKNSFFPSTVGLNDTWADGDAYYVAECRFQHPNDQKAPVLIGKPLWVTTFVFQAVGGTSSVGSDINLVPCQEDPIPEGAPVPRQTRVVLGAGGNITGSLGTANVWVTECWGDEDCDDGEFCNGAESCFEGMCVEGADPCPGQLCDEDRDICVDCFIDDDCDDAADCTTDTCVDDVCQYADTCADDGLWCNGTEFCNVPGNFCDHTGDPCPPGTCNEDLDICEVSGDPPLVEAMGSRYLAITPQPEDEATPMAFLVTSPDWPCLYKYVGGFYECGDTGIRCLSDANCNQCVGGPYNGPCLSDADCKTCTHNHAPCQTDDDCEGNPCVQVQTCEISGETCAPHLPLVAIDISGDDLEDGFLATLVDDPVNAVVMTPEEWGTLAYKRCSVSFAPCTVDGDCDVGRCNLSQKACSLAAQDCRNYCTESDWDCLVDEDCLGGPTDTCTVPQTCEPYETCRTGRVYVTGVDILPSEAAYTTTYNVQADRDGSISEVSSVAMPQWGDTDENHVVNFADIQAAVFVFLHDFSITLPPRTTAAVDLVGVWPCLPDQVVNFTDILQAVLAFKAGTYNPDVVNTSEECNVPCP